MLTTHARTAAGELEFSFTALASAHRLPFDYRSCLDCVLARRRLPAYGTHLSCRHCHNLLSEPDLLRGEGLNIVVDVGDSGFARSRCGSQVYIYLWIVLGRKRRWVCGMARYRTILLANKILTDLFLICFFSFSRSTFLFTSSQTFLSGYIYVPLIIFINRSAMQRASALVGQVSPCRCRRPVILHVTIRQSLCHPILYSPSNQRTRLCNARTREYGGIQRQCKGTCFRVSFGSVFD